MSAGAGILLDCHSGWVLHVRLDAKDFDLLQTVSSIQRAIRRGVFLCDDSELLWELFVGCLSGLSEFRVRKLTGQKLACFLIILVYDVPKKHKVGTGILHPVAIAQVGCIARSHRSPPSSVGRAQGP